MKIEKLFHDHGIEFVTSHKNIRDGWIGLDCPFCNDTGKYLFGYNLEENYFSCWQCGGHSVEYTIQKLLRINKEKAKALIKKYGGKVKSNKPVKVKAGKSRFKIPTTVPFNIRAMKYLEGRGFDDPLALAELWGLMYTGPLSKLDGLNYGNRILAPFIWNDEIVSFQARDMTEQHIAKYMACPPEREKILHKHILYGQQSRWGKKGICVEGIVDVWRFGTDAFATLGVKYTRPQVRAMKDHFEEVFIIYDPEKQAQIQAEALAKELKYKRVKAKIIDIHCDPGELSQEEADAIVHDLIGTT